MWFIQVALSIGRKVDKMWQKGRFESRVQGNLHQSVSLMSSFILPSKKKPHDLNLPCCKTEFCFKNRFFGVFSRANLVFAPSGIDINHLYLNDLVSPLVIQSLEEVYLINISYFYINWIPQFLRNHYIR